MNTSKNYITPTGFKKLKDEYAELLNHERPKLLEVIAWAAGNGDRSENADYIYGKRRLREIDRRLRFLSTRLDQAEVVDPTLVQSEKVVFGATVTIRSEDDELKTYQIVGEDEFDVKNHKISWRSPMAGALLGKKEGDDVVVRKPEGEEIFTIEKIAFM